MRRSGVAAVVFAATAFVLCACSRSRAAPAMPADARRVVSLAPAVTESLFAIGAGDRIVGRSRFCDWPPDAVRLPTVGGFIDVDLEAILQLQPDLVVGAPSPSSPRLVEQLEARGIATWFPAVDSFASIEAMIMGLGVRTLHAAGASRVVEGVEERSSAVERAAASDPAPRVLMVLDVVPVVAAGPKSFADEMIRLAHAVNVLVDGGPWQAVGFERIVELDPDVIIDASVDPMASTSRIGPQAPGWRGVRAVQQGRVVLLGDPRVLRPGPRVAEGLALLAAALHPAASVPIPAR